MSEDHFHALPSGFHLYEYRIQAVLGHGGFGITYLAWDTHLEKEVAIKEYLPVEFAVRQGEATVTPRSTSDEEDYYWGLERFLKEAQTLGMFRHPSIVPVYRFFEANGTAYIVMEYVKGDSLSAVMKKRPAQIDEQFALGILRPLLDGLGEVHRTGFLHRDIKPGNIYLRDDGSPVLLDFGAARDAVGRKSASLTAIVTPGYAPLEQYYADGNQGPWTDIYALGAILYQMATGSHPPEAPARVRNDPYVPAVQAGRGRFSRQTLQAIDAALAVDETKRPRDVAGWRRMFSEAGEAAAAAGAAPGPGRGKRVRVALAVLAGIVVLAAVGAGLYLAGVLEPPVTGGAPLARDDTARTSVGEPVEIAALDNDSDPDGGALELAELGQPTNGTAETRAGGVVFYTPAEGFEGEDRFDYTVADPDGMTATATVTVDVRGTPNRPPVARDDEVDGVAGRPAEIDVLANDSDPDGDTLTVSSVTQPRNGTVEMQGDRIIYTPKGGYSGQDRFGYAISDGNGGEAEAEVTLRIPAANRPPVAQPDGATTRQGQAVTINVLGNDSDPDGDRIRVEKADSGLNGTTRIRDDGRIVYSPDGDFTGNDKFTYSIHDGNGGRDTTSVAVTVSAPPAPKPAPPPEPTPAPSPAPEPAPVAACPYSVASLNHYYGPGDCFQVKLNFERGISAPLSTPPNAWSNSKSGNRGTFKATGETAGPNGNPCREFVQTVTTDSGETHSGVGMACFVGNTWRIQS